MWNSIGSEIKANNRKEENRKLCKYWNKQSQIKSFFSSKVKEEMNFVFFSSKLPIEWVKTESVLCWFLHWKLHTSTSFSASKHFNYEMQSKERTKRKFTHNQLEESGIHLSTFLPFRLLFRFLQKGLSFFKPKAFWFFFCFSFSIFSVCLFICAKPKNFFNRPQYNGQNEKEFICMCGSFIHIAHTHSPAYATVVETSKKRREKKLNWKTSSKS